MDLEKLFFTQEDAAFIHEQSLKVLAETGCVFDDEKARNVLQKHGARVDGNVVYFTKELVEKGLSTVVDSLEIYRPDGTPNDHKFVYMNISTASHLYNLYLATNHNNCLNSPKHLEVQMK